MFQVSKIACEIYLKLVLKTTELFKDVVDTELVQLAGNSALHKV